MANPQHIEWLLEGVEAWNERVKAEREKNPKWRADLREAVLREADLMGADLMGADLTGADFRDAYLGRARLGRARLGRAKLRGAKLVATDLRKTDLTGADLTVADLTGADLRGANLRGKILMGADLRDAFLGGADLGGADLRRANLRGADLGGADLGGADLGGADLGGADVKSANSGLGSNDFSNPEFTDLSDVLELLQTQLDIMAGDTGTILPSHLTRPVHWPDWDAPVPRVDSIGDVAPAPSVPFLFLSYSSSERENASKTVEFLRSQNITLWWDQDIPHGGAWRQTIASRLDSAKAVLTLWTEASTNSDAVIEEAATAQRSRKLLHARMDDAALRFGFLETQYTDLRNWDGTAEHPAMAKLLQAIRDKLNPPSAGELTARFHNASPIAFQIENGKMAARDTPLNRPPLQSHPDDLTARLTGLFQTTTRVAAPVRDQTYQTPPDLLRRLDDLLGVEALDPIIWYALEDTRDALLACIDQHDGRKFWNEGLVADLLRISGRITEIEPLLRPEQFPSTSSEAKPPITEPDLAGRGTAEVESIAQSLAEVINDPSFAATLDDTGADSFRREHSHLKDGLAEPDPANRNRWIRRGLIGLSMVTGSFLFAVANGVTTNLLTSPKAAGTLGQKLQVIFDALLKFFN